MCVYVCVCVCVCVCVSVSVCVCERKWLEFERLLGKLPSVGGLLTDVPVAEVWSTVRWEEGPCQNL